MICPKCGLEQPDAPECKQCGVIVAKYRPREAQPQPGSPAGVKAPAPPPLPDLPPLPPDQSPGWTRGAGEAPPGPPLGSRYAVSVDADAVRRVQAQAATKRFILVLLGVGVVVVALYVFVSFFKVYFNLTKLELDVTADASELANMDPDSLRLRVRKHVESYGFKIKDDKIRISWQDFDGKPLAKVLLSSAGIDLITAKVTIQLIAETRAVGILLSYDLKESSTITRRASIQDFRRWATDEYGEGKPVEEPPPEAAPAPAEAPPEQAPEPPSEPYQEPPPAEER